MALLRLTKGATQRLAVLGRPLRVRVDTGGCAGFSYSFRLEDREYAPRGEEEVIAGDSAAPAVVVDADSAKLLRGATLDFADETMRSEFVIKDNPLADSGCGCGVSFSLSGNDGFS